ncbi:MAG: non-canonical purine NTP pyrophosphatase, RdgB/HAM1 family [Coxiella sp. (in: Bacteria)]|nr:MAG: non-canonical purine NTP pyrophosphatase, RdgB/HAM1 family [Coxiella sp. (in: g-proteobacteria)]
MTKKRIVLASGNKGKIRELQRILCTLPYDIVPQSEFDVPDADETGLTYIENAILKARHACAITKLPAIADDSGICIDALKGAPGIYSARYAGPDANDVDLINKVLKEMKGIPDDQRGAQFHCVIAYLQHETDPDPIIAHGIWRGRVVHEAIGVQGFGYDPIFFLEEQQCTAAELDPDLKSKISHRGQALQVLLKQMATQ